MAAIEVRDLTRSYRRGEATVVRALDGVTVSIDAGEFVSVVGRAGSGKTTFLHCLGLLVRPISGQVLVEGVDTAAMTDARMAAFRGRRIGFVLRDRNLLPGLTALENVMLPLRYGPFSPGARARAQDLLDLVGLGNHLHHRPSQLSVGQAQRVAIARAMIKSPTVVLADEPTGELDDATSDELLHLMQEVNQVSGVAFVVATQDPDVASRMDRVIRIRDGQVASDERLRVGLDRIRKLK
jgi:putative ABC transport system ATP-binding protein